MRKLFAIGVLILASTNLTGCSKVVELGFEGVAVDRPFMFGHEGVNPVPQEEGTREWYYPSTKVIPIEIRPVRYDEDLHDIFAKDNVPVSLDAGVSIKAVSGKTPSLYQKAGKDYYERKIQLKFLNLLRNFARSETSSDLTSNEQTTEQGQVDIKEQLQAYVDSIELPVIVESVFIGKATPPKAVLTEIANTASQTQRIKTEGQRQEAENARKDAEEAKASADKAYMVKFGMSIPEYLTLRGLELQKEQLEIIKDKENLNVLMATGGANPQPMWKVPGSR